MAPFNSSLASVGILDPPVNAAFLIELYTNVLRNAGISTPLPPHSCSGDACVSTFIIGPIGLVQPPPPPIGSYSIADTIFVHRFQGVQVEFWDIDSHEQFTTNECQIWGFNSSAIEMCIGVSSLDGNYLVAGIRPHYFL